MAFVFILRLAWYRLITMEQIIPLLPSDAVRRFMKKGTLLLGQGDAPNAVYFVISGSIKVLRAKNGRDDHLVAFKVAGDMFPEPWAFGHVPITIYNYIAAETSEVVAVNREDFLKLFKNSPELRMASFNYMLKNYTGAMLQLTALGQCYATDKLTMALYYLMLRYGETEDGNNYVVKVKLSHSTLASLTGLSRETVTAELGHLRRHGAVTYKLGRLTICREALTNQGSGMDFADFLLGPMNNVV